MRYEGLNERDWKEGILQDGNGSRSSGGFEESKWSDSMANLNRSKSNIFSIEEARAIFELFDVNHMGKICKRDFGKAVRAVEGNVSEEEIEVTFEYLDRDGDGWISFEDFYSMFNE